MRNRKKKDRIKLLLVILLCLTLGFALLSTTLKINGIAGIKSNTFSIHWDSESIDVTDGSVESTDPVVSENDTKVSFTTTLELPGDFYEFTIDAVNEGTVDGMISDIKKSIKIGTEDEDLPEYIKFSVKYADGAPIQKYQYLKKRVDETHPTKETYKVRLEYLESATVLPSTNKTYTIEYEIDYQQADDTAIEREVWTNEDSDNTIFKFDPDTNTILGFKDDLDPEPTSIEIPEMIDGIEVKTIGDGAFAYKNLTAVKFNKNLETIMAGAFFGTQLTKVEIPDSVKTIIQGAFNNVTTLEEIVIGEGLTELLSGSFGSSTTLPNLTSVTINNAIIGKDVFTGISSLSEVKLGNRVTKIGTRAFSGTNITEIKLPNSIKEIGYAAFASTKISTIQFPEGLKIIGEVAFADTRIEGDIVLPSTVTMVGDTAFSTAKLEKITILGTNTTIENSAFYVNSGSNQNLLKIINKSGKSYDWDSIINGKSTQRYTFETGNVITNIGTTVEVVKE